MSRVIGRNEWCPCGSGKKVKNCCRDNARRKTVTSMWPNGWTMAAIGAVAVVFMGWIWLADHEPDPRTMMPNITQAGSSMAPSIPSGQGSQNILSVTAYTEIPEIDLNVLTDAERKKVLDRVNVEKCPCGCGLTIAGCRHLDQSCATSLPIARKIVAEETSGT